MRKSRTVTRETWPFIHFPTAFEGCAVRIDPQAEFDPVASMLTLDGPPHPQGQFVEIKLLDFNAEDLATQAGVPVDDLEISILYGNPETRRYETLWSTPAKNHDKRWKGKISARQISPRRSKLTLYLRISKPREKQVGEPWRKGSILAERSWTISTPTDSNLFSFNWTSFRIKKWPELALWKVEFLELEDFHEIRPEDAVSVHINKDLIALRTLLVGGSRRGKLAPIHRIVVPTILAGVTVEVVGTVLRWAAQNMSERALDLEELDSDSLLGTVLSAAETMEIPVKEQLETGTFDESRLTTGIQQYFKAGTGLSEEALEAMRR